MFSTCYEKNLEKHLRICNAREKDNGCDYIIKGINSSIENSKTEFLKLKDAPQSVLDDLIRKIQLIYEGILVVINFFQIIDSINILEILLRNRKRSYWAQIFDSQFIRS